ncbi:MAG: SDR family oxidoreductase [Gammaproteobacteria bacterium]|nr:SDR family oxidoreductase [Gammaproteobacteria bacterium]
MLRNIAGFAGAYYPHEVTDEFWQRMIAVNHLGRVLLCQAAMPHLLQTKGNIVNMASSAAIVGQVYNAHYCASKGGGTCSPRHRRWSSPRAACASTHASRRRQHGTDTEPPCAGEPRSRAVLAAVLAGAADGRAGRDRGRGGVSRQRLGTLHHR